MSSAIDPTKPADGAPAVKADLRANLEAAKGEIEALQAAQLAGGGLAGQVLAKASGADYDTQWVDPETGAATLAELGDVDLASAPPSGGEPLVWDAAIARWRPGSTGPAGTGRVFQAVPITNPGAEAGNLGGWTAEAGSWSTPTSAGSMSAAHSGSRFFYQQSAANGILTQSLDLIALGFVAEALDTGATFNLLGWAGSAFQNDTGIIEIDWLSATGSLLKTDSSGERGPTDPLGSWEEVAISRSVPIGTRQCKLRLITINRFGSNSTYCFDDLSLEIGVLYQAGAVEIWTSVEGQPAASQVILRYLAPRSLILPPDLAGSRGAAGVGATAPADFDLRRNGSSIGTMRFAAGATVASFIAAAPATFAPGDVLTVVAPAAPDATLADLAITLLASV